MGVLIEVIVGCNYLKKVSFLVCWHMETTFRSADKFLKRYCTSLYIVKTNEKVEKLTVGINCGSWAEEEE